MADTTKKYVSLEKLGLYDTKIKGVISAGDAATLEAAQGYADSLATNYDAAGAAATAKSEAIAHADAEVAKANAAAAAAQTQADKGVADAATAQGAAEAAQAAVDALAGKVGDVPADKTVMGIIEQIQADAYDDSELRGLITGLENNKADKTQVATDIGAAKTELQGKIDEKAAQTALDAVSAVANAAATKAEFDEAVESLEAEDERIAGLVTAEAERAAGVEAGLKSRIETMEVFWDTAEDADEVVNKLKEIQDYIASDESGAATMAGNIQANADAIAAMDEAYKKADETLQGNIDTLAGEVAKKAAQADLEALSGKVTTAEGKITANEQAIAALQGADETISGRIDDLEAMFEGEGEGTVADQIADAKQEAIEAAASAADTKDEAVLAAAKKYADDEDAKIESRVDALEGASHTHANKDLLDTYTQTEANLADAVAKKHEHANKAVLDGITAAQVAAWDAAEANAKAHADAEVTKDRARLDSLEAWHANFVEVSEEDINALFQ